VLPPGGTRILGILVTFDAELGLEALRIVRSKRAIPVHYNDYPVLKSPPDDFRRAVDAAGWGERVTYLAHGETYELERPAASLRRATAKVAASG
jgi:L-ascorbate metabolism protein UlaG (beta-lactamase superfamily)